MLKIESVNACVKPEPVRMEGTHVSTFSNQVIVTINQGGEAIRVAVTWEDSSPPSPLTPQKEEKEEEGYW